MFCAFRSVVLLVAIVFGFWFLWTALPRAVPCACIASVRDMVCGGVWVWVDRSWMDRTRLAGVERAFHSIPCLTLIVVVTKRRLERSPLLVFPRLFLSFPGFAM